LTVIASIINSYQLKKDDIFNLILGFRSICNHLSF